MTKFKGESDVFGDRPSRADISAVEKGFLEVVDDIGGEKPGGVFEVERGIEFGECAMEVRGAEEEVGVEVGSDVREQCGCAWIEGLANTWADDVLFGEAIFDREDVVMRRWGCRGG